MSQIHCGNNILCPTTLDFLYTPDYVRRAGVIPFIVHNGITYILLGYSKEKNPVWADLGGRAEDDETTIATALREFGEESRYVLSLNLNRITKVLITGRKGSVYPDQVHLVVEVDPSHSNININDKFLNTTPRTEYENEMQFLRWISYDEFMRMKGLTLSMEHVRDLLKSL